MNGWAGSVEGYKQQGHDYVVQGNWQAAYQCFETVIGLAPTAENYFEFGNLLQSQQQWERAENCYRRVLQLCPQCVEAYGNLGNLYVAQERWEQALFCYQQVLAVRPEDAETYYHVGRLFQLQQRWQLAVDYYQQGLRWAHDPILTYYQLGQVLDELGCWEEAIDCCRQVLLRMPDSADSYYQLALVLQKQGHQFSALSYCQQAVELSPGEARLHFGYAQMLLRMGKLQAGWREYEWRIGTSELIFELPQPRWDGSPLEGRRLLIHWEQGFGDTLQFVRYLRLIKGGKVLLVCQRSLVSLLKEGLIGVENCEVFSQDQELMGLNFEVWLPLLSLPHLFGTDLGNIPNEVPYLSVESNWIDYWQSRCSLREMRKIGIAWAGSPTHTNDRMRSCSLSYFAVLKQVPQVVLCSLQKGSVAGEVRKVGFEVLDFSEEIRDFRDTAALVCGLDLVICVDTAVAHLAGALGKPVWVLLPYFADWRWLMGREDSPWYPTIRLFRQQKVGDWAGVLEQVRAAFLEGDS